MSNGLVYFICTILADHLQIGYQHDEAVGCVNDFLWDKRGVDVCMRDPLMLLKWGITGQR
jgi:hypothetical protein